MRVLLYLALFLLIACKKDELKSNINLKDQPLSTMKKYVNGDWKLLYAIGGITGNIRTDFTDNFWTINNDHLLWKNRDTVVVDSDITWQAITDIWQKNTYIMLFKDWRNYPYDFIPLKLKTTSCTLLRMPLMALHTSWKDDNNSKVFT